MGSAWATVKLFDPSTPLRSGYHPRGTPAAVILATSSLPGFAETRGLLETWFSRFPADAQADLCERFHDPDRRQHHAAAWELFLHGLHLREGFSLTLHPNDTGYDGRPDFAVERLDLGGFVLEGRLASDESDAEAGARARREAMYARLDEIESPDFTVTVIEGSAPRSSVPKACIDQVRRTLASLDHDELAARVETRSPLPQYPLVHEGAVLLHWSPVPKRHARGTVGRAIGALMDNDWREVDPGAALLRAAEEKAGKAKRTPCPTWSP